MKTSDKLLLTLALLLLATFGAIHLTLYARMKAGHITSLYSHVDEGWVRSYAGKAPSKLTLKGNINVTLIPSDSFKVEVQSGAADRITCRMSGDSMIIKADSLMSVNSHGAYQAYSDLPWVSIDIPSDISTIRLEGQMALLRGTSKPDTFRINIQAVNSLVWLGETYGAEGSSYPTYYYDSVHVQEENSSLVLHKNAEIRGISVHLDPQSEFNDLKGISNPVDLQYAPQSKINIKGATLDNLKAGKPGPPEK